MTGATCDRLTDLVISINFMGFYPPPLPTTVDRVINVIESLSSHRKPCDITAPNLQEHCHTILHSFHVGDARHPRSALTIGPRFSLISSPTGRRRRKRALVIFVYLGG